MLGHESLIANTPVTSFPSNSVPVTGSNTTRSIPKNGNVADPGFAGVQHGKGETIIDPVSILDNQKKKRNGILK